MLRHLTITYFTCYDSLKHLGFMGYHIKLRNIRNFLIKLLHKRYSYSHITTQQWISLHLTHSWRPTSKRLTTRTWQHRCPFSSSKYVPATQQHSHSDHHHHPLPLPPPRLHHRATETETTKRRATTEHDSNAKSTRTL